MNKLVYKVKNKFFNRSDEAKKILRPAFDELMKYNDFKRTDNNKVALGFGVGRSGQNWFSKIFNSHNNWIGTCERFSDYEAFYRYITHNNVSIDKSGIYKLFNLAIKHDLSKYGNTFISSPYFANGANELCEKLKPDYIFYNLRNPISSIESIYNQSFYDNQYFYELDKLLPIIDVKSGLYRNCSRITPIGEFREEWTSLTRIGKITWFWAYLNRNIYDSFNQINVKEKDILKLEDVNANYDFYLKLSEKYNFDKVLNKKGFDNIRNKSSNIGLKKKYKYIDWTQKEKEEFNFVIEKFFPYYDSITTTL